MGQYIYSYILTNFLHSLQWLRYIYTAWLTYYWFFWFFCQILEYLLPLSSPLLLCEHSWANQWNRTFREKLINMGGWRLKFRLQTPDWVWGPEMSYILNKEWSPFHEFKATREKNLITYLHLLQSLKMQGALPPFLLKHFHIVELKHQNIITFNKYLKVFF